MIERKTFSFSKNEWILFFLSFLSDSIIHSDLLNWSHEIPLQNVEWMKMTLESRRYVSHIQKKNFVKYNKNEKLISSISNDSMEFR